MITSAARYVKDTGTRITTIIYRFVLYYEHISKIFVKVCLQLFVMIIRSTKLITLWDKRAKPKAIMNKHVT